jgi:hypothetical protein
VNEIKTQFGNNISSELWQEIIKEADENGDGEVTFF